MDFLEYSKKCHFWLFPKNHKKYATTGTKVNELPHFCLKRALRYLERFRTIIGHFGTRRIFYTCRIFYLGSKSFEKTLKYALKWWILLRWWLRTSFKIWRHVIAYVGGSFDHKGDMLSKVEHLNQFRASECSSCYVNPNILTQFAP